MIVSEDLTLKSFISSILVVLITVCTTGGLPLHAEEVPATAAVESNELVEQILELLGNLEGDAGRRDAVRQALQQRLDALGAEGGEERVKLERALSLVKAVEVAGVEAIRQGVPAEWLEMLGKAPERPIEFNLDVRPILSNTCFTCHGPDEKTRKAGLRLDMQESVYSALKSGNTAVSPGNLLASSLAQRIMTHDNDDVMPPQEQDKKLSEKDKAKLLKWIQQGAEWQGHWSFQPIKNPEPPQVAHQEAVRNPIDNFILARLEQENLSPSPETDKNTLIRRVTFDLTGLPPTPEEVDAFLNDESPEAYEKVVDRLLASPRYGEHQARIWLDLARYADTNGYHIDNERYMWRWRDWVINAYNNNMPFDEFTVEQLAGDLLEAPSLDQLIATGFNRNHMITFEGGVIPEEYLTEYIMDRVNTTSTVWMGLTMNCAQCHDHKYDPLTMRDYYSMYAFYNTIEEKGIDGNDGNANPKIKAPTPEQQAQMQEITAQLTTARTALHEPVEALDAAQTVWEAAMRTSPAVAWSPASLVEYKAKGGATLELLDDGSVLASGENPDQDVFEVIAHTEVVNISAIRLEALAHESFANGAAGRADNGNFIMTEIEVFASPKGDPSKRERVQFAAVEADFSQPDFPITNTIDGNGKTGWAVEGHNKPEDRVAVFVPVTPIKFSGGAELKIRLRHESNTPRHTIGRFRFSVTDNESMRASDIGPWYRSGPYLAKEGSVAYITAYEPESGVDLAATYEDGRAKWVEVKPGLPDGQLNPLSGEIAATYLYRVINAPTARNMDLSLGSNDAVKLWVNGNVVLDQNVQRGAAADQDKVNVALQQGENRILMKVVNYGADYQFYFRRANEAVGDTPLELQLLLAKAPEAQDDADKLKIKEFYRSQNWPEWGERKALVAKLEGEQSALEAAIPDVMVMKEMKEPRKTFILARGEYDQPGEEVFASTPAALPPLPEGFPTNRLGLAKWLISNEHPLTARVVVNRYWQQFFGWGIVHTSEDFGAQGESPTHPLLLDWLATHFRQSGWDVKAFMKLLVMSGTYRQDTRLTPELLEQDQENILLARGPRFRLDAEMVRDNTLAVAGLLVEKLGGPSVKPYQPKGIWEEVAYGSNFTAQRFEQDSGDALYRRSMYTFWKRQAPPPGMMLFDAPNRENCTAQRARTNTPLQALALMNDVQYVEAARKFAERILTEGGDTLETRIQFAFKALLSRSASAKEIELVQNFANGELARFDSDATAAEALLEVGDSPVREDWSKTELAAWTTVANMLLNLDEAVTKG